VIVSDIIPYLGGLGGSLSDRFGHYHSSCKAWLDDTCITESLESSFLSQNNESHVEPRNKLSQRHSTVFSDYEAYNSLGGASFR
jgi:hypothetical protein